MSDTVGKTTTHETASDAEPSRVQLHLTLPYKFEPRTHPDVRKLLDRGYRINQLQRVTDREALVTLVRGDAA